MKKKLILLDDQQVAEIYAMLARRYFGSQVDVIIARTEEQALNIFECDTLNTVMIVGVGNGMTRAPFIQALHSEVLSRTVATSAVCHEELMTNPRVNFVQRSACETIKDFVAMMTSLGFEKEEVAILVPAGH